MIAPPKSESGAVLLIRRAKADIRDFTRVVACSVALICVCEACAWLGGEDQGGESWFVPCFVGVG